MRMNDLNALLAHAMKDLYSAEKQILDALPEMAQAASHPELVQAFEHHFEETRKHVERLEEAFSSLEYSPGGERCEGVEGLIEEGESVIEAEAPAEVKDAALIIAAQKVEHYEIASYGCLHEWAELLDNAKAARLLLGILDQEKEANEALNEHAHSTSNNEALSTSAEAAATSRPKTRAKSPASRGGGRAGKAKRSRVKSVA
jgi:ferritin-like metal-binding protein YciE